MARWNISLLAEDYRRMRRHQLGREPSEEEIRAINGFVEYVIAVEVVKARECCGTHEAAELLEAARHTQEGV